MRLVVLGGSAAGPNTGIGCSSYLIQEKDTTVAVDLGPGTVPELRRHCDFRQLSAVVISHWHVDHVLDLATLRYALAYNPVAPSKRMRLFLPPNATSALHRFGSAFTDDGDGARFFDECFTVSEYDPDGSLAIGPITVTFRPGRHYVPVWMMRFQSAHSSRDIAYSADTGPNADFVSFARGSSLVVAEATLAEPGEEPYDSRGHLTPIEAAEWARDAGATRLLLTHRWEENSLERAVTEAKRIFDGPVEMARPGLRLDV